MPDTTRLYTCKVHCSFDVCFDFSEDEIERKMVNGIERIIPSEAALEEKRREIEQIIEQSVHVSDMQITCDVDALQEIAEI